MIDKNKTNAPVAKDAPAAPKTAPKPVPKPRDPYIRAENEDVDLILDIGNSRTTGILVETPPASPSSKPTPGAK